MENGKLIALSQYLQTQEIGDSRHSEPPCPPAEIPCPVFDFLSFKKRTGDKKARALRAKARAHSILKVIKGLVADYEIDMNRAAEQCDVEAYMKDYGHTPQTQIAHDMRRLQNFVLCLEAALAGKKIATLLEACNALRQGAEGEVIDTLNYILVSDYFGFQAIKAMLESARLTEEAYLEDTLVFYKLWNAFSEAEFTASGEAIAELCFEEAVAI